jgi:methylthioribose-1-phosphate isomerase
MNIDGKSWRTIWPDRTANAVNIIDQTLLPHRFEVRQIGSLQDMVHAIKTMQVRGAPLIGAAAAYGMVLALQENSGDDHLEYAAQSLISSRPTAVNLSWAVKRVLAAVAPLKAEQRLPAARQEAAKIADEDVQLNRAIGQHGLGLLRTMAADKRRQLNILTHCNAGWLATVDWGTALAPVYAAHDSGLPVHVWVDETRPRNQGASLTAWELGRHGVPHTVISDNAGGHLMQHGEVDMVIVGADRVTAAGDVCNKIGTYLKALAAFDNGVPFYAAVPSPTMDWAITDGLREIEIEHRDAAEVASMQGLLADGSVATVHLLPAGSAALNPAFDVTPARLVSGIISECGVSRPDSLHALFEKEPT